MSSSPSSLTLSTAVLSAVCYVTGVRRTVSEDDLMLHFSDVGQVSCVVFPTSSKTLSRLGYALVSFSNPDQAKSAVQIMNNSVLHGKSLCVRIDQGISTGNASAKVPSAKYAITRQIEERGSSLQTASYTSRLLIMSNGNEYPFPTGAYLMKLLRRRHLSCNETDEQLFDVILGTHHGNNQCKETSEVNNFVALF